MEKPVDRRGKLEEEAFSYQVSKEKKVFITWHKKQAAVLSGGRAEAFLAEIEGAQDKEAQLVMAKATGNFKRDNEKMDKRR